MVLRRRLASRGVRRWIQSVLLILIILLVCLEAMSVVAIEYDFIAVDAPNYRRPNTRPFWIDRNPYFGMWHEANTSHVHTKACFSVTYRTNAYGVRDRSRQSAGKLPRVVVIGDSFIEGNGLEREDRTTEILELGSGVEHLNFGTSGHFGPTQSWLLYKHLAKRFEHDVVVFGLLPDNDFVDDDPTLADAYAGQYRPYLIGKESDYELKYANVDQRVVSELEVRDEKWRFFNRALRNYTYMANVVNYLLGSFRDKALRRGTIARVSVSTYSGYYDFTRSQAERLLYVLEQMLVEAGERTFFVVIIPRPADIRPEPAPILSVLEFIATEHDNLHIIDLRKSFARHANWPDFYRDCDGQWSPAGARAAAETLLADPRYRQSLELN